MLSIKAQGNILYITYRICIGKQLEQGDGHHPAVIRTCLERKKQSGRQSSFKKSFPHPLDIFEEQFGGTCLCSLPR